MNLPPELRRVGYVFQEYALFPHMSVRQNVAFGGAERADELLQRFGIAHLAKARPPRLSGGERQRVGLARALASDPAVLLFDEPLSALDAHTRGQVRAELHDLLHELRLPSLLVTHDFDDATTLADRVGVIVNGRILRMGTPAELLADPGDAFVASFVGSNVLRGVAGPARGGLSEVSLEGGGVIRGLAGPEGPVGAIVNPWDVTITRDGAGDPSLNRIDAPIASIVPVGDRVQVRIGPVIGEIPADAAEALGLAAGAGGERLVHPRRHPAGARAAGRPRAAGVSAFAAVRSG